MKRSYVISANFPELLVKDHYQEARVVASHPATAVGKAIRGIFNREGVKHHRITKFTIAVQRYDGVKENS